MNYPSGNPSAICFGFVQLFLALESISRLIFYITLQQRLCCVVSLLYPMVCSDFCFCLFLAASGEGGGGAWMHLALQGTRRRHAPTQGPTLIPSGATYSTETGPPGPRPAQRAAGVSNWPARSNPQTSISQLCRAQRVAQQHDDAVLKRN